MGMLRLRFVADKVTDETVPDPRIAVLVERARDRTLLDFSGWTPARTPTDLPTPTSGWKAPFGKPGQAYIELLRLEDLGLAPGLLGQVYWIDIDATGFEDGDYYVYFYDLIGQEMQCSVLTSVVNGDDMSLAVRLKKSPVQFAINGNFSGLPGSTGKSNITGSANATLVAPTYRP
jgi:hypothetical protein